MAIEFESPTVKALLVIETEPFSLGPRAYRPLKLFIRLARQFFSKLRP